jgi:hypothetical protein
LSASVDGRSSAGVTMDESVSRAESERMGL